MDSVSEPTATPRPRGLIGYAPELIDEIVALQYEMFPQREWGLIEPRWRWMFEESARRVGVAPMVWVYRASSGVVAHHGAIAVRCKVGDQTLTTGWFVETMVHEKYRGRAVGPMLVKKALEDVPFNLSLGQTTQMREMQFALGWVEVAPLPLAALAVRGARVLTGKGHPATRPLASLVLDARRRLGMLRGGTLRGVDVVRDGAFGAEHDALWERVAAAVPVAVVRDASFLTWKYRSQPGQRSVTFDVRQGARLLGTVAYVVREPDSAYRYRRAVVTDILVPPSEPASVRACVRALHDVAREDGVDLVSVGLRQPVIEAELRRQGYLTRPPQRVFLVAGPEGHPVRQWLDAPDAWFLSTSDSDIDRPW
ncbi:GNAT family N-acetyltransferase [Luteitalea sp. TBR-22]|uniref:GNAT family N-acetyltransferase n=1 Tax=Luteitalea sp. TBR-22 TaxID=2802971 RepID=UPI001EF6A23D|nr:GNAT family N-acetyltransferase [Luteitalea sp. TBR-22]